MKHEDLSQLKKTWKGVRIETATYPIKEKDWKSFGIGLHDVQNEEMTQSSCNPAILWIGMLPTLPFV